MIEEQLPALIGSYGFPIAAFLLMWWTHNTGLKKLTEAINELKVYIKAKK